MKKLISVSLTTIGLVAGAFAQGTVTFDNSDSPSTGASLTATNFGSIYLNGGLLHQDINLTLLGGATPTSLVQIVSLTFANGLAQGDNTFLSIPGQFFDPTGGIYTLPGVPLNGIGYVQVEAWTGNDPTFFQAVADSSDTAATPVYATLTGGGSVGGNPPNLPVSIGDAMPSIVFGPEPSTLALCGLGAASLLLFRRKK